MQQSILLSPYQTVPYRNSQNCRVSPCEYVRAARRLLKPQMLFLSVENHAALRVSLKLRGEEIVSQLLRTRERARVVLWQDRYVNFIGGCVIAQK